MLRFGLAAALLLAVRAKPATLGQNADTLQPFPSIGDYRHAAKPPIINSDADFDPKVLKELATKLTDRLTAENHSKEVIIFMQGDSTLWAQVSQIENMIWQNGDNVHHSLSGQTAADSGAVLGDILPALFLNKIAPEYFPEGTAAIDDDLIDVGGVLCNVPAITRTSGDVMGYNMTVIGVACTKSALQIGPTPALIDALIAPPYNFAELAAPSIIYTSGSTLHFMHNEFSRSYGDLKDYVDTGAFESNLQEGLKAIKAHAPADTKIAFFNVHTICDDKLGEDDLRERALACAAGNETGCYGCERAELDAFGISRCAEIAEDDKLNFRNSLMSTAGGDALAKREKSALTLVELADVELVDGHKITADLGCSYTGDGRHYDGAPVKEAEALLDII